jgi:hypothetical protein
LDALNPSFYDKGSDMVDNIDEFIHVERRKWDVIGFNEDPIYYVEGYLRIFPLQQSYDVPNNFDVWKQDNDIITKVFQAPKDDPVQCSPDDFRSYLIYQAGSPWFTTILNIIFSLVYMHAHDHMLDYR